MRPAGYGTSWAMPPVRASEGPAAPAAGAAGSAGSGADGGGAQRPGRLNSEKAADVGDLVVDTRPDVVGQRAEGAYRDGEAAGTADGLPGGDTLAAGNDGGHDVAATRPHRVSVRRRHDQVTRPVSQKVGVEVRKEPHGQAVGVLAVVGGTEPGPCQPRVSGRQAGPGSEVTGVGGAVRRAVTAGEF